MSPLTLFGTNVQAVIIIRNLYSAIMPGQLLTGTQPHGLCFGWVQSQSACTHQSLMSLTHADTHYSLCLVTDGLINITDFLHLPSELTPQVLTELLSCRQPLDMTFPLSQQSSVHPLDERFSMISLRY